MIHVIIVNYETSSYTEAAVRSLMGAEATIWIIDNGSPDAEEVRRLLEVSAADTRVRVMRSDTNLGFGAAVNRAVEWAAPDTTDLIWILNPDTLASPEACYTLAAYVEASERTIASPVIMTGDKHDEVWFAGGDLDLRRGKTLHRTSLPCSDATSYEVTFLTGTALMLKMSTWLELGGFREDLFLYWEDTDLSLKAAHKGIALSVVAGARIWHRVGGSTSSNAAKSRRWYYYMFRNRLVVCASDVRDVPKLLVGRGLSTSLRHLYRALREPGPVWPRLAAMASGTSAGIRALRYEQRDHA